MSFVIHILDTAIPGMHPFCKDTYVKDVTDTPDGRGSVDLTRDPNEAKRFTSIADAAEYYQRVSETVPVRPDGRPNRPLTAYTVEIENAP